MVTCPLSLYTYGMVVSNLDLMTIKFNEMYFSTLNVARRSIYFHVTSESIISYIISFFPRTSINSFLKNIQNEKELITFEQKRFYNPNPQGKP